MKEKLSPGYRWADCKRFPRLHASPFFRLEPAAGHNARARTCTRTTQKFDLLSLPCSAITAGLKSHLLLLWTRFIGIVMGAHSSTVFFFFFFFFYLIWKCPATNVLCCSSSVQTHTHTHTRHLFLPSCTRTTHSWRCLGAYTVSVVRQQERRTVIVIWPPSGGERYMCPRLNGPSDGSFLFLFLSLSRGRGLLTRCGQSYQHNFFFFFFFFQRGRLWYI